MARRWGGEGGGETGEGGGTEGSDGGVESGAALLFDHVLVDDSGDDGQGDDVPGGGQNLCDFFVLEKR